jgi:hypothetical protein
MIALTKRPTWTGDLRAALGKVVLGNGMLDFTPAYFNDRHKTCRRIKFTYRSDLTDSDLVVMQEVIQARRPELNVTVSRWEPRHRGCWFGNYVIYYRPKNSVYMNH